MEFRLFRWIITIEPCDFVNPLFWSISKRRMWAQRVDNCIVSGRAKKIPRIKVFQQLLKAAGYEEEEWFDLRQQKEWVELAFTDDGQGNIA